jgi:hypothetical protein
VLEWEEKGDAVIVRKAGRYTSKDIHRAIFARRIPESKKAEEFDKCVFPDRQETAGAHFNEGFGVGIPEEVTVTLLQRRFAIFHRKFC